MTIITSCSPCIGGAIVHLLDKTLTGECGCIEPLTSPQICSFFFSFCWEKLHHHHRSLSQLTSSSGGPSSASSGDCSSPILLRSQTLSRLSVPLEARMVSLWGDHWTCWKKMWIWNLCNYVPPCSTLVNIIVNIISIQRIKYSTLNSKGTSKCTTKSFKQFTITYFHKLLQSPTILFLKNVFPKVEKF